MPFIKKHIYPFILVILCLTICFLNYKSNTFLTGWDTLHPEFNFPLNFSRLLSGVWRSEQGLGAIAGHSHMSDLPRVFILWLFHFFMPLNFLRYAYIFLCFIIGPLGIYYLINHLFKNKLIAFITALFYIFNLNTLQQFYVPFEMFPTHWCTLPFIIFLTLKYLQKPSSKNLLIYTLITLLSTPMAYAAHLWYTFFGIYCAFLFFYYLYHKNSFTKIKTLIISLLLVNSFWLLPNIYYALSSSHIPQNTKVNRLYSQEYLLQNRQTGFITNTGLNQGFYFNWKIYNHTNSTFEPLLSNWQYHLNNPLISFIAYFLFLTSIAGLCIAFIKKDKKIIPLSAFLIIPLILLLNHTPPFEQLFNIFLKIPIIKEIFRFIFTKISVSFIFGQTIFFAYFIKHFPKKTTLIYIPLFIILCFPYFKGDLISSKMKVNIPDKYFEFWDFMKNQENGTILPLPLHNFTGWQYYNWGYQGAGFIWFNLKQPILDRDFDRWAPQNEQSFREFFYSLYGKDAQIFEKELEKYNIKYIFWDKSITTPFRKNREQIVFSHEIEFLLSYLQNNKKIEKIKEIDNLSVYKIIYPTSTYTSKTINQYVKQSHLWDYWDKNYINYGNYFSKDKNPKEILLDKNEKVFIEKIETFLDKENIINYQASDFFYPDPKNKRKIENNIITYNTTNESIGSFVYIPDLSHDKSYLIGFKSRHLSGLPLRICIKNTYNNICTVYEQLNKNKDLEWNYYLIPPQDSFKGFDISIDNISYGFYPSINQISEIKIIPIIDYESININKSENINPTEILLHPQAYHPGWIAFYLDGYKPVFLKDHILVNNWANGWQLPSSYDLQSKVYYLFWPQLLQYLGFILGLYALFQSINKPHSKHSR